MKPFLIAMVTLLLFGCAFSFEEARSTSQHRLGSPADPQVRIHCQSIDRERAWYGALAAVTGACSAGTGIPAIIGVTDDQGVKDALYVTMAVCGVTAAGLVILRDSAGQRWVANGCGQ